MVIWEYIMAKMNVTIMPDGEIKMQIEGIKGKKCLDISKGFEESLGEVTDRKFTSDYYAEQFLKTQNHLKEKG
jgi:hypothetical protein